MQKDFGACGFTARSLTAFMLTIWEDDDADLWLPTMKLVKFMDGDRTNSLNPLAGAQPMRTGLLFHLGTKHTVSLAPEKRCVTGLRSY